MSMKNSGICLLCGQEVPHRSIAKHLNTCLKKEEQMIEVDKGTIFLVKAHDAKKLFWLFIEINDSSTLEQLDSFLRKTWLECCGHMSAFSINGKEYSSDGEMRKMIRRLFEVDDEFDYAYDFGSTTELKGKIISNRAGKLSKNIRLIARNNLPDCIKCTICGNHPKIICPECYDFFCEKCKKKHAGCEGEEFFLPVVNSPRMGVCGYTGED